MKKLLVGWHDDYYWTGLFWHTRPQKVKKIKCIGTGLTIEAAQADLQREMAIAQKSAGMS